MGHRIHRRGMLKGSAWLAGAAAVLSGANAARAEASGEPVPIGQAAPLTDFAAADGVEFRNGLIMACDEINALGGILGRPLEPHFEDTKQMGDATNVQAVQRLIDRYGVHAVINGYNTGSGSAVQDAIADAGIIYMHNDTSSGHGVLIGSDPERYFGSFQTDPSETWYGSGLLKFLSSLTDGGTFAPANRKLAIILSAGTYSSNIANVVREGAAELGWEVSLYETVNVPISEWGPTLSKLRQDPPGVIVVTHYFPADLAQFMVQFMTNPTPSLIYMQYGPSVKSFRDIAGPAAAGVVFSTVIGALQDEIGLDFEARYKARFGDDAGHNSGVQSYNAAWIWAAAAALAGGSGAPGEEEQNRKVAERIRAMIHRGPNGTTRFMPGEQAAASYPGGTDDPSLGMPHQFLQIQDHTAEPVLIAPWPYAKAGFITPPWIRG
ncbi:amino acid ABC transporter substrate-binding protein [Paracoccus methylovorus]|jgi:branched-chain amino acid transport system substrate-binding protein|nr:MULTISPECIES: ABC transporter substrate-binding protein [Paracoccus]MBB4628259.1 branched-chain amino acid transport system substrate-binding protein [Paracoccus denitrificans]MCU7429322.1 ABC transporter substrate-binding protein [Paracoccus denitrificans]MDK8873310.1 ABC transporter substrate-binding protein [Paracoccus sp. SSJ]QAR27789.1 amino acid ABC transporter substrate-binding protein [Paracoccus denitrificans]QLH14915.1 amino acid ABC transporter substrate-binding protein [Paracocc